MEENKDIMNLGDDNQEDVIKFKLENVSEPESNITEDFLGDDSESDQNPDIKVQRTDIDGHVRLKFAKHVLIWLAIIFVLASGANLYFETEQSKTLWSFTSTAVNSLTALVVGYYFARKHAD